MNRFLRLVVLLPVLHSVVPAADLPQILKKMDETAISFKGLTADVNRDHLTYITQEHEIQKGTLTLRRPKPKDLELLLDIKEPQPQMLSLSGRVVLLFDQKSKSAQQWNVGKYSQAINQYMLLGFGSSAKDLQESYTIVRTEPAVLGGRQTTRIELTPKKPDTALHLVRAELWISDADGIAVQQRLTDSSQNTDVFTYTNIKIRADISAAAVKINLPRGVKPEIMR